MQHFTLKCSPLDWTLNSNPFFTQKFRTTGKYGHGRELCCNGGGLVVGVGSVYGDCGGLGTFGGF